MIKSRMLILLGHVACMGKKKFGTILVGKHEGKRQLCRTRPR
jgi:hypothetical protein